MNELGVKPEEALYEFANDLLTCVEDSGMLAPLPESEAADWPDSRAYKWELE